MLSELGFIHGLVITFGARLEITFWRWNIPRNTCMSVTHVTHPVKLEAKPLGTGRTWPHINFLDNDGHRAVDHGLQFQMVVTGQVNFHRTFGRAKDTTG